MSDKETCAQLAQKIKELEQELLAHKQLAARFECIFKAIPDAALFTDPHRRIVLSNPALGRLFGYDEGEVEGKHTEILYSNRDAYEEQGKLRFNLSAEEKIRPYEVDYRKKNGQTFPSETIGTVVKDTDGQVLGYLVVIRDISERKRAEHALQKAHDDLEQRVQLRTKELSKERDKAQEYLDIAGVMIVVLDMEGNISLINKEGAAILGHTEKEIKGKNWFDNFISEQERARVKAGFFRVIAGESLPLDSFENSIVTKDGEERLIEWHNTILRDTNGKIINTLSSGNDITERKKAEIALQESSKRIKRIAYAVSHDMKSPAISLSGLTRRLSKKYENQFDEKGKMYCRQIMCIGEQINLLVENINSFITTTETPFHFEPVDLKEVCDTIREEFVHQLLSRKINWSEPEVLPIIKADRLSIIRVLRNLIDNALKYGGDALKTIEISYLDNENNHILSVIDDGKGFNEEERENMFTAFTRNTNSGDVFGTGLGLAIVKEIAEKHGGNAWADPAIGQGATFHVSISKNIQGSE
jgi:PAS domain S-box-containing protein